MTDDFSHDAGCSLQSGADLDADRVRHMRTELFAWWDGNARDLPWRFGRTSPWGVLVSEVMSQQTQMSRVVPYWESWMQVWPTPQALAAATPAEVITAWGRLGYPRRALRLQSCARVVAQQYGGVLPDTYDELVALPGIGDYTASAVLSFAFGHRIVVLDTNIRRVLSRAFAGAESLGGATTAGDRALAEALLPPKGGMGRGSLDNGKFAGGRKPGKGRIKRGTTQMSVQWNQSVMELGALVCTAKSPACDSCPLADSCAFLSAGRPSLGEKRTRPRQHFKGTNRQVRGIVLDALRRLGASSTGVHLSRKQVDRLWEDTVQLDACIASLDEDGLIVIYKDGSLSLPQ